MPLYEYECFLCHHRFERIQRASAQPANECPECGGAVRRLLGVPALQFKGSGWYVTDYGNGRSRGTTETGSESSQTAKSAQPAKPENGGGPGSEKAD